jgi:hypothetical protein
MGRFLRGLINRRGSGARIGAAVVLGGLVALSSPASASAVTSIELGNAAQSYAADGTPHDGKKDHKDGKHHKKKQEALCIDSSQQSNEKFIGYVPERGELWIWKENRGAGSVDPWVQFTQTADEEPTSIPEGVVCVTVVAKANTVAVTIVTENGERQVWQTECTVNPDTAEDPFDPNGILPNGDPRCEEFEELTPLPDTISGDANDSGSGSSTEYGYSNQTPSSQGPNTGDGASVTASTGLGPAAMAGGALLALAVASGTVMLRRRRGQGAVEA